MYLSDPIFRIRIGKTEPWLEKKDFETFLKLLRKIDGFDGIIEVRLIAFYIYNRNYE
jgi:hypothetical protein